MSLSTPAEFVHSINALDIEPLEFCTHLLHSGAHGNGFVTPEEKANEFNIHTEAANHLHDLASEFNLVIFEKPSSNRVEVNMGTLAQFIQFITLFDSYASQKEIELLANQAVHDAELTIAVPENFEGRSAELMARLIRLVRNADTELQVVTPFFTRFGVDTFVDHLASATGDGVQVILLTRDITNHGDNTDHVQRIFDTVSNVGEISNLQVHEYDSPHGRLHAKALIVDRTEAYVGSANFTNYSLREAIEVGLIVQGSVVGELSDFFDTVIEARHTRKIPEHLMKNE